MPARRWSRFAVAVTATLLVASVSAPQVGQAAPPATLAQVRAELASLNAQAETAQEALNQTAIEMVSATRDLAVAKTAAGRARADLRAAQTQVGRLASQMYRSNGLDPSVEAFFAPDTAQYLEQVTMLATVAAHQADVVRLAAVARQRMDAATLVVDQQLRAIRALHDAAVAAQGRVRAAVNRESALLASLQAAQRAALAREAAQARAKAVAQAAALAAQARAQAAASAAAARARAAAAWAAAHPPKTVRPGKVKKPVVHHRPVRRPTPPPPPAPGGSSIGARVVAYALSKVGDAYVWGAAGPSAYDCSGLTMKAYAQVGISLPHSSSGQSRMGHPVSASQLRPGDLVFYYSPIHHVGIYIGGGMIVNAENPSVGVTITGLYSMPYSGAVRPY